MNIALPNTTRLLTLLLSGSALAAVASPAAAQMIEPSYGTSYDQPYSGPSYGGSGYEDSSSQQPTAATAAAASRPSTRIEVSPYVEIDQSVFADLKGDKRVDTYTTLAAGVDVSMQTRRAFATVSARYSHDFSWQKDEADTDSVSGILNAGYHLTRGLTIEGGALATETRVDSRGNAINNRIGNLENRSRLYAGYIGPTYAGNVGQMAVNAAYRYGYSRVENANVGTLPAGTSPLDYASDSQNHHASASIGMQPGQLPVGWAIGGAYNREDGDQLDSRIEDAYVRGDLTVPVSATLALVGGVGYEKVDVSERDALRDGGGVPVVGADGRLVTDPTSPRLTSFSTDGVFWDVGVMWRPSARTSLEARVGQRYDSETYYGAFNWAPSDRTSFNISVYDQVTGFGGLVSSSLANLGSDFIVNRNPLTGDLGSCAVGSGGALCYDSALQSASSAGFRVRGVTASVSTRSTGGWNYGAAAGYQSRKYFASSLGGQAQLSGTTDDAYFASISAGSQIGRSGSLSLNVYGNYFDPALSSADILSIGANASYGQQLMRNLSLSAAVGLNSERIESFETQLTASGLLGLRYGF